MLHSKTILWKFSKSFNIQDTAQQYTPWLIFRTKTILYLPEETGGS
jgi:hypothetical protein